MAKASGSGRTLRWRAAADCSYDTYRSLDAYTTAKCCSAQGVSEVADSLHGGSAVNTI